MKCLKCGRPAVFHMRHHKLALCEAHYPKWFIKQTERAIKKYRMFDLKERVLIAVLSGKDSLALWDVLMKLGYAIHGLYIDLGINGRLNTRMSLARKWCNSPLNAPRPEFTVVDLATEYGESLPQVAQAGTTWKG